MLRSAHSKAIIYARQSVCIVCTPVSPSVTRWYCGQTNPAKIARSSPSESYIILVFKDQKRLTQTFLPLVLTIYNTTIFIWHTTVTSAHLPLGVPSPLLWRNQIKRHVNSHSHYAYKAMIITNNFEHGIVALEEDGCNLWRKPDVLIAAWQTSRTPVLRIVKVRVWNPAQNSSVRTEYADYNNNSSTKHTILMNIKSLTA